MMNSMQRTTIVRGPNSDGKTSFARKRKTDMNLMSSQIAGFNVKGSALGFGVDLPVEVGFGDFEILYYDGNLRINRWAFPSHAFLFFASPISFGMKMVKALTIMSVALF